MTALYREKLTIEQMRGITSCDTAALPYLPALLTTLAKGDEEHRGWAADALATIEQVPTEFAAELVAAASSHSPAVVNWACRLLVLLGPAAASHQHILRRVLRNHAEMTVRQQAALSLGQLHPLENESRVALAKVALDSDPRLSRLAQAALQKSSASAG